MEINAINYEVMQDTLCVCKKMKEVFCNILQHDVDYRDRYNLSVEVDTNDDDINVEVSLYDNDRDKQAVWCEVKGIVSRNDLIARLVGAMEKVVKESNLPMEI